MAEDVNSRKSLSGYLLTYIGEQSYGSLNFSSVSLCLPLKQSILQSLSVDKGFPARAGCEIGQLYCVLGQLELSKEFGISFKFQAYLCEVSLDMRHN